VSVGGAFIFGWRGAGVRRGVGLDSAAGALVDVALLDECVALRPLAALPPAAGAGEPGVFAVDAVELGIRSSCGCDGMSVRWARPARVAVDVAESAAPTLRFSS